VAASSGLRALIMQFSTYIMLMRWPRTSNILYTKILLTSGDTGLLGKIFVLVYYFSALTINLFGIVDLSRTTNKLNCYAYREFKAKKGNKNVASLLMQDLFDKFWLRKFNPRNKLTIAMDNCEGQEKNNGVLCLALFSVELEYFERVEFMFYIRGHTKNACDHTFNQMKLKHHKKDIFAWGRVIETLNTREHVNVVDAKEDILKNYGAMLDTFYRNFKIGTIPKNHIFKVEDTDKTMSMQCTVHSDPPFINQPTIKQGQVLGEKRTARIDALLGHTVKAPGLHPIKQVELYKKFRSFVPSWYWDETFPRPINEVLAHANTESAKKRITKAAETSSVTTKAEAAANTPAKRAARKEKSALKHPARKKTKDAPV
jgi:hypothetical protein